MPLIYDLPGEKPEDRVARLNDFERTLTALQEQLRQTADHLYEQASVRAKQDLDELTQMKANIQSRLDAITTREQAVSDRETAVTLREGALARLEYDIRVREQQRAYNVTTETQ